jgi:hypothetical protein
VGRVFVEKWLMSMVIRKLESIVYLCRLSLFVDGMGRKDEKRCYVEREGERNHMKKETGKKEEKKNINRGQSWRHEERL